MLSNGIFFHRIWEKMGFLSESSTFSQSLLSLASFSSGASPSLLPCSQRKVAKKKVVAAMASPQGDTTGSSHRRTILLVGLSVLPLMPLRAIAVEDLLIGQCGAFLRLFVLVVFFIFLDCRFIGIT